jgi:hypothetical protein
MLFYTCSWRSYQGGLNHGVFRLRVYCQNNGGTFYVGDGSWGFGISRNVWNDNGWTWFQVAQTINVFDFGDQGNAGWTTGYTYNAYLQVRDSNDNWYYAAGEADGSFRNYTPAQMQIWVI